MEKRDLKFAVIFLVLGLLVGSASMLLISYLQPKEEPLWIELNSAWVLTTPTNISRLEWLTDGGPRKVLFISYLNKHYEKEAKILRLVVYGKGGEEIGWLNWEPEGISTFYLMEGTFAVQLTRRVDIQETLKVRLVCSQAPTVSKQFTIV